jgi:membrane protease YdiL (CAAX protease family)
MDNLKQSQRQRFVVAKGSSPWAFFTLALGWSWLFWIPLALLGWEIPEPRALVLFVLGGAGVPLAGIILTYLTQGPEGQRDYWRRAIDFKRISLRWYLVIFLLVPLWTGLGILTGFLMGEGLPILERARDFLAQPLTLLPFAFLTLLYGPIPEELGWRGYALDRLEARWSALSSSLILGVF